MLSVCYGKIGVVQILVSSYAFLIFFLPLVLSAVYLNKRWNLTDVRLLLLVASLVFYGTWSIRDLGLIICLIVMNYGFARAVERWRVKPVLLSCIAVNLLVLFYFKYFDFFHDGVLTGAFGSYTERKIHLPLGISFFTFQKIAYLADVYKKKAPVPSKLNFGLFIAFFPQLIAGPIVHYRNLGRQIERINDHLLSCEYVAIGVTVFTIGMMKKILLADRLSLLVDPVWRAVSVHGDVTCLDAWLTMLAYSLQIYFDFSGYTDMAIGLALLFGISLPDNFLSPYRSRNIAQFWRRWHITLSRFLRDYLYIPLGGNRVGLLRGGLNLIVTMFLGGLWHGANWTFVIWGLLHGFMLAAQRLWSKFAGRGRTVLHNPASDVVCIALTFLFVSLAWVFFRAPSINDAFQFASILFDPHKELYTNVFENLKRSIVLMGIGLFIVFAMPNTCLIRRMLWKRFLENRPILTFGMATFLAIGFVLSFIKLGEVNAFIYFQF